MADLSASPAAARAYVQAVEGEGGRVKVGAYRFSAESVGAIYVAENVFRESLAGPDRVAFSPVLRHGVDPNKEKYEITDFEGDFRKPSTNMRFRIYTVPPTADNPRGRESAEPFRFKPSDRSFSHGSAYGGPVANPDGTVRANWDRACRELLHWIQKRVKGFEDLFFEDPKVIAALSAKGTPPVKAPKDKTFAELGVKPRHRPISVESAATRARMQSAPIVEEERAAKAGSPSKPPQGVKLVIKASQKEYTIDYSGPEFPDLAYLRQIMEDLQRGLLPEYIANLPIEQILPTARMLEYVDGVLEGGLLDREAVIRFATEGKQFPGSISYERCVKQLERLVERLNAGTLAVDLDVPPFGYRLEQEVKSQPVGVSTMPGQQPVRPGIFYRKVALEPAKEMQVLR